MGLYSHCGCGPVVAPVAAPATKVAPVAAAPCVPYSNVGVVLVLFILLVIILRAFWC
ncbi:hypothetical protein ACTHSJ_24260 [Paenibacillus cellulositrophicus]|jgi:hypothetical protein|nr:MULTISPECIES: hypothetical protein [Paenibacillus]MBJ9991440.1 hypothetical protein [Paenibacillus sp. S28]MCM2995910.1 hypothetical protein [Paenibacillus cellulositrophicus]RED36332.1 hypothetical protein C7820_3095 [Paenibacillus sp. VMFN-D1]